MSHFVCVYLVVDLYNECWNATLDLVLILDESSSLIANQPNYDNWNVHMLGFAISIVRYFPISPNGTQIGLMKFSSNVDIAFDLSTYTDVDSVVERLRRLDIDGGDTNIAGALHAARSRMFVEDRGTRHDVRRVVFLVTDGAANVDEDETLPQAQLAKDAGIEIFTVGVTTGVDERQLKTIASYPPETHFYYVPDFRMLNSVVRNLTQNACLPPVATTTTTTSTTTTTTANTPKTTTTTKRTVATTTPKTTGTTTTARSTTPSTTVSTTTTGN